MAQVLLAFTAKRVRMSPDKLLVILFSSFDDALSGGTPRAEGCHEGAILTAQNHYVWVRLVEVVVELGKPELLHLPLASAMVSTPKRAPPGLWRGDLLQISRPEQPLAPIREAHIYDYVHLSSVATHNLADQTSTLLYPVVVCHLNSQDVRVGMRLHHQGAHFRWWDSK
jgi:hypothetical protein